MSAGNYNAYGSYIQLSTFDEREKAADGEAKLFLGTLPYRRFLCTKRDAIIVGVALTIAACVIITTLAVGIPRLKEKERRYFDTSFASSPSPLLLFRRAAVLADGEHCATVGKDVLEKNGSAVDAAVAALFCNGVVTPQSMGLGGGFFMIVYINESKHSEIIDAREVAPLEASQDMFHGNRSLSLEGGLSIAVPGELMGYWLAQKKYGKLKWKELIEPSIKICEEGFAVSSHLADKIERLSEQIMDDPSLREEFYNNETGALYKENEIMTRPRLGRTLRTIADKGADALYAGELTEDFVKDMQNCGSIITKLDLEQYEPEIREPVKVKLRAGRSTKNLLTMPPPGSGLIVSLILQLLQEYNMTEGTMGDLDRAVLAYHHIVEAFKFGFSYRTQLADPAFANLTQLVKDLTDKDFLKKIRNKISDDSTFPPEYYGLQTSTSFDHGTAQVSVLAPNGDAVSVTSTINTYFGSLCRSPSTGIILNNEMDGFTSPNITDYFGSIPSARDLIEPRKRPLSSMSPSILTDEEGEVEMVVGGMGGTRIITALAQHIIRVLWLNEDVKAAVDAPRIHHQLSPNYIQYEKTFPRVYLDRLKNYGHESNVDHEDSQVLSIVRRGEKVYANVDYRKGGSADGL